MNNPQQPEPKQELRERVKELTCLYAVSSLASEGLESADFCAQVVKLIPPAMQYPEHCYASIAHKDATFTSHEAPLEQKVASLEHLILIDKKDQGKLEVHYTKGCPAHPESPFLDEEYKLLKAIAEILSREIKRKKKDAKHVYQAKFERLLARVSSHFVSATPSNFDESVEYALKKTGKFLNVDRCYLFIFNSEITTMSNTHEWCARGIEPQLKRIQNVPTRHFSWLIKEFLSTEYVSVNDTQKMPSEASFEQDEFLAQKIQSLICVPLRNNHAQLLGFIGMDAVKGKRVWKKQEITILKLVSEVVGSHLNSHKALKSLVQSEQQFKIAFEFAPDGVLFAEVQSKRFVFANRKISEMTGYSIDELRHLGVHDIHPASELPRILAGFEEKLRNGGGLQVSIPVLRKDGSVFYADINTCLIDLDKRLYLVGMFRDVTQRKQIEQEHIRAREAAEAALRAKDSFVALVSHELRTPLTPIIALSEMLAQACQGTDVEDQTEILFKATQNLSSLVNTILDLSRMEAESFELDKVACSPETLINECIDSFAPLAEQKKIKLRLHCITPIPTEILGDPLRIRQVLNNLIGNAVKFTRIGEVVVEVSHLTPDTLPSRLRIRVLDTGIGLPEGKINELFEAFVQADNSLKREFGGSGLGLSIVRRLSHHMGANLTASNRPEGGACFEWSLPIEFPEGHDLNAVSRPHTPRQEMLKDKLVLIVEDDSGNQFILAKAIRSLGAHVDVCDDAESSLNYTQKKNYDLILMDLRLPVMDGCHAAELILAQSTQSNPPKIVAISGDLSPQNRIRCKESGIVANIEKPYSIQSLRDTLGSVLQLS